MRDPYRGVECAWYAARLQQKVADYDPNDSRLLDFSHRQRRVNVFDYHSKATGHPFLLDDGTGICLITLGGDDVDPGFPPSPDTLGGNNAKAVYRILDGQHLFVTGYFVPLEENEQGASKQIVPMPEAVVVASATDPLNWPKD